MTEPSHTNSHANEDVRILIDQDRIAERVSELALELERELGSRDGDVTLVPVMTGSMLFVADLIRQLRIPIRIEPVTVQSYPGTATHSRGARLQTPVPEVLRDKHVLIVDDILDSGGTLSVLRRLIGAVGPKSVRACVLLSKDVPRSHEVACEHSGFDIPDEFVVGYGLDYDGLHRNLPYIGVLSGVPE